MDKQYEEKFPVTVYGTDSKGEMFIEDGHTQTVARAWVRLPLRHRLQPGAEIIIFNKNNGNQAEFLIERQEGGAFKAVLKDLSVDIWEKDFGVPPEPEPDLRVRVHIVCERCGTRESVALEDEDVDRLLEGQPLRRHCAECVAETDWHSEATTAERRAAAQASASPAAVPQEPAPAAPVHEPTGAERRTTRRIQMKTKARVRRASGTMEIVVPVNVSRGGIAFESRASYELEEVVHVAMHYREGGEILETPGRIVRVSRRKDGFEYGVRFEG